jgi:hypothetical protein
VFSFFTALATNSHVLSAAAGAITAWAVGRFSTFMGWYAKNEAAISKATGVPLPKTLPTTVAEMKAAAAPVVSSIPADVEKTLLAWKGDIVADVKKL